MVSISGGTIGDTFGAYAGSEIHIRGTEFFFDGSNIDGLVELGDSIVLNLRDADLTGRLLDGNRVAGRLDRKPLELVHEDEHVDGHTE